MNIKKIIREEIEDGLGWADEIGDVGELPKFNKDHNQNQRYIIFFNRRHTVQDIAYILHKLYDLGWEGFYPYNVQNIAPYLAKFNKRADCYVHLMPVGWVSYGFNIDSMIRQFSRTAYDQAVKIYL